MQEEIIDLGRLESYRENNRIEAKKALGGLPRSLWETYSAFANTLGGIILLGVEEKQDHSFLVHDLPDPEGLMEEFWSIVTDRRRVSVNILSRDQVRAVTLNGKRIVAITVPRADRKQKPVYLGPDAFTGSYRRDGEGDYHCTAEEVESMLRDAGADAGDGALLEQLGVPALDWETVARYRRRFDKVRPDHIWRPLSDEVFLERIHAMGRGSGGIWRPTAAGLLMFGKEREITGVYPCYVLCYQEMGKNGFWTDLAVSDSGDFSGNLFDFYEMVCRRLKQNIRLPDGEPFCRETLLHKSLEEALINCLVHADYREKQGVLIRRVGEQIMFENPGSFATDAEEAMAGNKKDARHPLILQMFHLINAGNGEGKGLREIYASWKKMGFAMPDIREEFHPPRVQLSLTLSEETGEQRPREPGIRTPKQVIYETRKQQVIDLVTRSIRVSTGETARLLGIGTSRARKLLRKMTGEGILERTGEKGNTRYQLKR